MRFLILAAILIPSVALGQGLLRFFPNQLLFRQQATQSDDAPRNQISVQPQTIGNRIPFSLSNADARVYSRRDGWLYKFTINDGGRQTVFYMRENDYRRLQEQLRRNSNLGLEYDPSKRMYYRTERRNPVGQGSDLQGLLDNIALDTTRIAREALRKRPVLGVAPTPDPDRPGEPTDIVTFDTAGFIKVQTERVLKDIKAVSGGSLSKDELIYRLARIRDGIRLMRTRSTGAATYYFGSELYIPKKDLRLLEDYEDKLTELINKMG